MSKIKFAFIVHSRDRSDLPRKYPFLSSFPNFIIDFITKNLPPIVVSKITGLVDKYGNKIDGLVIGVPMTAHQLLENKSLALKRILSAIKLAKSKGAKYIGLGAMTSSLTAGGNDVINNIKDIYITTGRTYTIKNITDYILRIEKSFNLDKSKISIGIVGAAGGIGSGVAILLAKMGYKNFYLIDLERKLNVLREKILLIEKHSKDVSIDITHRVDTVSQCKIIIAATSAPEVVIKSQDVSPGTIIINDAQPSDISPEIIENRKDVLVIEGGVLNAPGISCNFNMGLSRKDDIFSCLAETLILAHNNSDKHYSINQLDFEFLELLSDVGVKLRFNNELMQNSMGIIDEKYIKNFIKY